MGSKDSKSMFNNTKHDNKKEIQNVESTNQQEDADADVDAPSHTDFTSDFRSGDVCKWSVGDILIHKDNMKKQYVAQIESIDFDNQTVVLNYHAYHPKCNETLKWSDVNDLTHEAEKIIENWKTDFNKKHQTHSKMRDQILEKCVTNILSMIVSTIYSPDRHFRVLLTDSSLLQGFRVKEINNKLDEITMNFAYRTRLFYPEELNEMSTFAGVSLPEMKFTLKFMKPEPHEMFTVSVKNDSMNYSECNGTNEGSLNQPKEEDESIYMRKSLKVSI